jgi:hypothetical protein
MLSRLRHSRALVAAIAFFICGRGGSPEQQHEQARETLQSWINAIYLAQQHRATQRVPALFVTQLLKEADKALARERKQMRDQPDLKSLAQKLELKIRQAGERKR